MKAFGRRALDSLATLWILFGGLGLFTTLASLVGPGDAHPGWQWTLVVSVFLVLAGIGILRRYPVARWIAAGGVAGALAEAAIWLSWMWTPILIATAAFHAYGLAVLLVTEFRPILHVAVRPRDVDPNHRDRR